MGKRVERQQEGGETEVKKKKKKSVALWFRFFISSAQFGNKEDDNLRPSFPHFPAPAAQS